MISKTAIVAGLVGLASLCGVGWLMIQDSPSIESGQARPEQTEHVDEVIPFVASPARPVEPGRFQISEHDGLYSVRANEAWRSELLAALAVKGDFDILDHVRHHPSVSLDVRDQPLEIVFAHLLRDEPYSVRYDFVEKAGKRDALSIDLLEVGIPRDVAESGAGEFDPSDPDSDASAARPQKPEDIAKRDERKEKAAPAPRSETERRRALERRVRREARRHAESLEELEHADPEVRAWAASELNVDDAQDLAPLARLLGNDPDPAVRAEIAYDLGFGDPSTAVPLLISALHDPVPEVVATAAESLGYLNDASAVSHLRALQNGQPENVRDAAEGALERLDGQD